MAEGYPDGNDTFVAGARLRRPQELMMPQVCKVQLEIQTIGRSGVDLTPRMKLGFELQEDVVA